MARGVLAVTIPLAMVSSVAWAEPNPELDKAKSEIEMVQLDAASQSLTRALDRGGNTPEQLAEIYRLRGEVAVGRSQKDEAVAAFVQLIVVDPDAKLGELVSPKIKELFDLAKLQIGDKPPLVVSHQVDVDPAIKIHLRIERDAYAVVKSAQVQYRTADGAARKAIGEGAGTIAIALAENAVTGAVLHVLDARGNRVRSIDLGDMSVASPNTGGVGSGSGVTAGVGGGAGLGSGSEREPGEHPLYRKWWTWAAVTGAFAATGVGFTFARSSARGDLDDILANDGDHFLSDAQDARDRVNRYAAVMGIGYGLAGAAAIVGTILVLTGDAGGSASSVSPTVSGDGAGVSFEVSF